MARKVVHPPRRFRRPGIRSGDPDSRPPLLPGRNGPCVRVFDDVSGQEHEGDGPVEFSVLGLINDTHPAFPELGEDLVVADSLPDQDGAIVALLRFLLITIDVTNYDILRSATGRSSGPSLG